MKRENGCAKIAFFPDGYQEVDGVATASRRFEAFARNRNLQFLTVHAGIRKEIVVEGSVTRIQLPRSLFTLPLDRAHQYDFALWRHFAEVARLVQDFQPDVIHITGPSDVGMLGAFVAHKLSIPLAANWQTNLHQYARTRLAPLLSFLPDSLSTALLAAVERWSLGAAIRFYKIPRFIITPNREMVSLLEQRTGKPCFLIPHGVDTTLFSPQFRDRSEGPFTIGYVGRLTREKNVRLLAYLEHALLARGRQNFRIVITGEGTEGKWLRQHMWKAEFTGILTGRELSRAFANMDALVFPSETDTFGLVVLEALASGVPAIVSSGGGPKDIIQHGATGYIANSFEEFVTFTDLLLTRPDLIPPMSFAARQFALSTSWDKGFEALCEIFRKFLAGSSESLPKPRSPSGWIYPL